jgi:UDP-N-acetylglucosamine acyltransferase
MEDLTPFHQQFFDGKMNKHDGNEIHPTAIIGKNVVIGIGNTIGPYCIIQGNTIIGNDNKFEAFCSIGSEPEHKLFFGKENQGVIIGNNNYIREYVTVNAGCYRSTIIENECTLLRNAHIGHDSYVSDNCTISCNVLIGGHSIIGKCVNMGLGAICHQFTEIAPYCMIGMGAILTKNNEPTFFGTFVGNPAKFIKINSYQFNKFTDVEKLKIEKEFKKLCNELIKDQ